MYCLLPSVTRLPSVPEQQNVCDASSTLPPLVPNWMGRVWRARWFGPESAKAIEVARASAAAASRIRRVSGDMVGLHRQEMSRVLRLLIAAVSPLHVRSSLPEREEDSAAALSRTLEHQFGRALPAGGIEDPVGPVGDGIAVVVLAVPRHHVGPRGEVRPGHERAHLPVVEVVHAQTYSTS